MTKIRKTYRKDTSNVRIKKEGPSNINFSGININQTDHLYFLEQYDYAKNITKFYKAGSFDTFRTTRRKLVRLVNTRPEIISGVKVLSQVTDKSYNEEYLKKMNNIIKHITNHPNKGLNCKCLGTDSSQLTVF